MDTALMVLGLIWLIEGILAVFLVEIGDGETVQKAVRIYWTNDAE